MGRRICVAIVVLLAGTTAAASPHHAIVDTPPQPNAVAPRVLYLNRCIGGCGVTKSSVNDARRRLSTLPGGADTHYSLDQLAWTDDEWAAMMHCVREVYSPYDIAITDIEPADGVLYNEGVIAGRATELGLVGVAGISALAEDCSPLSNTMSFVFGNNNLPGAIHDVQWLCWAVAHETGHAFGLDHSYMFADGSSACRDPMSYRTDCGGQRFFRAESAKCGEGTVRDCKCSPTQNAHYHLLSVLGQGTPTTAKPVVDVVYPRPDTELDQDYVVIDASAQRGVDEIELWFNGARWVTWPGAAWEAQGQPPDRYAVPIPVQLPDGIVDIVVDVKDDIGVSTRMPPITVTKGAPCQSADTCAFGQRCDAGRCLWDPPVGEFGETCDYPQYCKSGICGADENIAMCTTTCSFDVPDSCPDGFECLPNFPRNLCWPAERGGCCSGSPSPPALAGLTLLVMVQLRRRRRHAKYA